MTKLIKDFETFLDSQQSVKPYYQHHKDNGFKAHLQDAKNALKRGNIEHAKTCIQWAKEAKNNLSIENDSNNEENSDSDYKE